MAPTLKNGLNPAILTSHIKLSDEFNQTKNSAPFSTLQSGYLPTIMPPSHGLGIKNLEVRLTSQRRNQKRMFSLQQSLPRLPVPPLEQTVEK